VPAQSNGSRTSRSTKTWTPPQNLPAVAGTLTHPLPSASACLTPLLPPAGYPFPGAVQSLRLLWYGDWCGLHSVPQYECIDLSSGEPSAAGDVDVLDSARSALVRQPSRGNPEPSRYLGHREVDVFHRQGIRIATTPSVTRVMAAS